LTLLSKNQWRAGSEKDSDISPDRGMPELPLFKNSTRALVEDVIWGNKERKYIANYGNVFYMRALTLIRGGGVL
jgi:hypothetical protein